jgi:hypothetical protein
MFTLHKLEEGKRSLNDATVSIGILDPAPPGRELVIYDFGLQRLLSIDSSQVVAVAEGDPARVSFAPKLKVNQRGVVRRAANARKVVRLPIRRLREEVPTSFVSGYANYARPAAMYWREHGVGSQPLLAAGVFSLSSIQVGIDRALILFSLLTPHVVMDELPSRQELSKIVKQSRAGFDSPETGRPAWYAEYDAYRYAIVDLIAQGLRDDELRRVLATQVDMPLGLGLAKLSFTLALVGNNLGCIDARILEYAFTEKTRKRFNNAIKKPGRRYSKKAYNAYRSAEKRIFENTPFYDPDDPVALARSQWLLWESLGPETARTHSHEEMFRAILEPAWRM